MSGAATGSGWQLSAAAISIVAAVAVIGAPQRHQSPRMVTGVATSWVLSLLLLASDAMPLRYLLIPGALLPLRFVLQGHPMGRRGRTALSFVIGGSVCALGAPLAMSLTNSGLRMLAELVMLLGLLWRMGVFPLHGWLPELAEDTPLPVTLLAGTTPIAPLLLVAVIPTVSSDLADGLREPLIALGATGALYGAVLALAQDHLRRMLAYLAVGQSGVLLAAVAVGSTASSTGVALAAIGYGLPLCGLMTLATAIESRTGSARVGQLRGLGTAMPHLTAGFLVLGFAFVGFPGSLGFVAEDLMLHGILADHPATGAVVLFATAINAITIFRCFQRLFLGPPPTPEGLVGIVDLLPRERLIVVLLALLVTAAGVCPAPLVTFVHDGLVSAHAASPRNHP